MTTSGQFTVNHLAMYAPFLTNLKMIIGSSLGLLQLTFGGYNFDGASRTFTPPTRLFLVKLYGVLGKKVQFILP